MIRCGYKFSQSRLYLSCKSSDLGVDLNPQPFEREFDTLTPLKARSIEEMEECSGSSNV